MTKDDSYKREIKAKDKSLELAFIGHLPTSSGIWSLLFRKWGSVGMSVSVVGVLRFLRLLL